MSYQLDIIEDMCQQLDDDISIYIYLHEIDLTNQARSFLTFLLMSTAAVTFDSHSLFLDGKQLFVFSIKIHPWRILTGVPGWRAILQKMKVVKTCWIECKDLSMKEGFLWSIKVLFSLLHSNIHIVNHIFLLTQVPTFLTSLFLETLTVHEALMFCVWLH
jgi:hypothetical protein